MKAISLVWSLLFSSLLCSLSFPHFLLSVSATCPGGSPPCSSHGSCDAATNFCQCDFGWLAADCSLQATTTLRYGFGNNVALEFALITAPLPAGSPSPMDPNGPTMIQIRHSFAGATWFGGIWNVGPDGMTSGDTWIHYCTSDTSCTASDRYSSGRNEPSVDSQQDLLNVISFSNSTHSVVEFTRYFVTSDTSNDIAFTNIPGTWYRYMWTSGSSSGALNSNGRGGGGGGNSQLSMHGFIGSVGQLRVDFAGNQAQVLPDGVQWPPLYYVVAGALILLIVLGLTLQLPSYRKGKIGRWMRSPLRSLSSIFSCCFNSCCDTILCNAFSIFSLASKHDLIVIFGYILFVILCIFVSISSYNDVGRSPSYLIGHFVSIQLAFLLLPITRHSLFQRIFSLSFNDTIAWHRRIGRITILLTLIHGLAMLILWDISVLFSTAATQWGMGTVYGTLSFVCMLILGGFALENCRRPRYALFLQSHIILSVGVYAFALLHSWQLRWLIIAPAFLFFVDLIWRFVPAFSRQVHIAKLIPFEDQIRDDSGDLVSLRISCLQLEVSNSSFSYQPGDHLYVNLPSVSHWEFHPISISSAPNAPLAFKLFSKPVDPKPNSNSTDVAPPSSFLTLFIQAGNPGNWTDRLFEVATAADRLQSPRVAWNSLRVRVDGPYSSGDLLSSQFPVNILIAGGIGVTPILSILNSLLVQAESSSLPSTESPSLTYFIWSCRSKRMMIELFSNPLVRVLNSRCSDRFKLVLHWTSASSRRGGGSGSTSAGQGYQRGERTNVVEVEMQSSATPGHGPSESDLSVSMEQGDLSCLSRLLKAGRPNLPEYFVEVENAIRRLELSSTRVLVSACGPDLLISNAREVADDHGFHFTNEGFKF